MAFRNDFKWNEHVDDITKKASKRLYLLKLLKRAGVDLDALVKFSVHALGQF